MHAFCIFAEIFIQMKKTLFLFFIMTIAGTLGCSSGSKNKMIGTWRAANVHTEFDEQRVSPQMIQQVVEMEKQVFFKFLNDSMMHINTLDHTNRALWFFDKENGIITYRFIESGSPTNELGMYKDGKITAESETALGKITIVYKKD